MILLFDNVYVSIPSKIIIKRMGENNMKNFKHKFAGIVANMTKKVVSANVNSCCMYVMYQDELPKGAEKFRKTGIDKRGEKI